MCKLAQRVARLRTHVKATWDDITKSGIGKTGNRSITLALSETVEQRVGLNKVATLLPDGKTTHSLKLPLKLPRATFPKYLAWEKYCYNAKLTVNQTISMSAQTMKQQNLLHTQKHCEIKHIGNERFLFLFHLTRLSDSNARRVQLVS